MTRLATTALLLAGCAISTDSFRGRGSGDWVKDEPFTQSDFDHDRIHCRAAAYDAQDDYVYGSGGNAADHATYAMMRARQGMDHCLRELGWKRASEQKARRAR